jgi:hypothetical protein
MLQRTQAQQGVAAFFYLSGTKTLLLLLDLHLQGRQAFSVLRNTEIRQVLSGQD